MSRPSATPSADAISQIAASGAMGALRSSGASRSDAGCGASRVSSVATDAESYASGAAEGTVPLRRRTFLLGRDVGSAVEAAVAGARVTGPVIRRRDADVAAER